MNVPVTRQFETGRQNTRVRCTHTSSLLSPVYDGPGLVCGYSTFVPSHQRIDLKKGCFFMLSAVLQWPEFISIRFKGVTTMSLDRFKTRNQFLVFCVYGGPNDVYNVTKFMSQDSCSVHSRLTTARIYKCRSYSLSHLVYSLQGISLTFK
jgi:hypothetical protein